MMTMFALFMAWNATRAATLIGVPPRGRSAWLTPNERHPIDAAPFVAAAPAGVYAACGTERGLIGFAYSKATYFAAFDRDPDVLNYVQLAILMLKLAADGGEYRGLMSRRGLLRARLDRPSTLTAEDRAWVRDRLAWWEFAMPTTRPGGFYSGVHGLDGAGRTFLGRKYWRDANAFAKLKAAAESGRMSVAALDLCDPAAVRTFAAGLPAGVPIAVLDIDSVWLHDGWVGPRRTLAAIESLRPHLDPDSLILMSRPERPGHFVYGGISHGHLRTLPTSRVLASLARREIPSDPAFTKIARRGWCARWLGQRKSIQ